MWMSKLWFWPIITPTLHTCTTKRGLTFKSLLWLEWTNSISMQEIKDLSQMVGLIYKIEKDTNEKKKDTQLLIASWKPITAHRKDFLPENKKNLKLPSFYLKHIFRRRSLLIEVQNRDVMCVIIDSNVWLNIVEDEDNLIGLWRFCVCYPCHCAVKLSLYINVTLRNVPTPGNVQMSSLNSENMSSCKRPLQEVIYIHAQSCLKLL